MTQGPEGRIQAFESRWSGRYVGDPLPIRSAALSADRRTVFLEVEGMRKAMQLKVSWNVDAQDGAMVRGDLHASVHELGPDPGMPQAR